MEPPPDPIGNEEPSADWTGFALNVGLKLAETFGLGLTLFNALRQRFEDVAGSILGDITSTIGQAVRAATGLTTDELNSTIALGDLPVVPASWHEGESFERVIAGVDVTGIGPDGEAEQAWRVWVNGLEGMTYQELVDLAQQLYDDYKKKYDPQAQAKLQEVIGQLIFIAKRF